MGFGGRVPGICIADGALKSRLVQKRPWVWCVKTGCFIPKRGDYRAPWGGGREPLSSQPCNSPRTSRSASSGGFPGGTVVENLPANAGDTVSSPGLGRSHMLRSNWAHEPTSTEPARLEPVLRNRGGHDSERPAHRNEEWPPLATARGSPRTETKTQHSQINK